MLSEPHIGSSSTILPHLNVKQGAHSKQWMFHASLSRS